jgi:chromatin segregation and condensation protein Rec8/ScpA/Scc1 (kleisin family)
MGVTLPERWDRRHTLVSRPVAMEDKIDLILGMLQEAARVEFSRLLRGVEGVQARMHGVMTFLAGLELGRRREVRLRQVSHFSELWLYRNDDEEAEPPPTENEEAS